MKAKIFAVTILAMIALGTIGYSYACWNGGIAINCRCKCYCNVIFTNVIAWDNEIEKDVAQTSVTLSCDKDTINAVVTNAYPCYEAYINFTIKNKGEVPVHIDEVKIEDYDETALEITLTDIISCTWISNCGSVNGMLTVHMLQEAEECRTYTFKVKIKLSCQTQHPRTIGFWKHQFLAYLCKNGKPQIPAEALENYLRQVNATSQIYTFSGTRKQQFQQALNILDLPRKPTMEQKLKAHLLALWLNYVAGWTEGWTVEGMTAWQIIQGSENALLMGAKEEYEYWKDLCDRFNNLG